MRNTNEWQVGDSRELGIHSNHKPDSRTMRIGQDRQISLTSIDHTGGKSCGPATLKSPHDRQYTGSFKFENASRRPKKEISIMNDSFRTTFLLFECMSSSHEASARSPSRPASGRSTGSTHFSGRPGPPSPCLLYHSLTRIQLVSATPNRE